MTSSNSGYSGLALRLVFSSAFCCVYCYKWPVYMSGVGLLLISCHDNKFLFTELRSIIIVIVTNPMFILPWVHEIQLNSLCKKLMGVWLPQVALFPGLPLFLSFALHLHGSGRVAKNGEGLGTLIT